MPESLYKIPTFLSGSALLYILMGSTLFFHWIFVYQWLLKGLGCRPLTKRDWKIVDYIWLGVGSVALIGTAFQARQILASSMLPQLESLVSGGSDAAIFYASPTSYNGILCRRFERSPLSPPEAEFNRIVAQYDAACTWAHAVTQSITGIGRWEIIDRLKLPTPPAADEEQILRYEGEMFAQFAEHNRIVYKRRALEAARQRSEFEETVAVLSPLLAVLALALRITKVTGEIRLG